MWKFQRHHQLQSATLYIDKYINQDRLGISLSQDSKEKNGQKTSSAAARLEPTTLHSVFAHAQAFTRAALLSCVLPALHLRPVKLLDGRIHLERSPFLLLARDRTQPSKFFHPYSTGPRLWLTARRYSYPVLVFLFTAWNCVCTIPKTIDYEEIA